jgi:hypothetical protein
MELSSIIAANVLQRGVAGVETRVAAHGDPAEYHRRRLIGADALLRAAGVYGGKPLDPVILAALDLQAMAMGILSAKDLMATLADGAAIIGYLARALGGDAGEVALAAVARAVREEPPAEPAEDDDDGASRLARRLRPLGEGRAQG